jgi:hypothetical protein
VATGNVTQITINLGTGTDQLTLGTFDAPIKPLNITDGGLPGDQVTVAAAGAGIQVANGDVSLKGFDTIALNNQISIGTGTLTLGAAGSSVFQSGAGALTAAGLLLTGTGAFALTNANTVGALAANLNGPLSYHNATTLTVGTVGVTNGITSGNGNVTLTVNGALSVNQNVNAGAGNLALTVGGTATFNGAVVTAASGTLTGSTGNNAVVMNYATSTTFTISGANAGSITNGNFAIPSPGLVFNGFGALTGGNGSDVIKFVSTGSLTGSINGGGTAGTDTLDYAGYTADVHVIITNGGSSHGLMGDNGTTGIGGTFDNIDTFVGNASAFNCTLGGPNSPNTWNITGTNAGFLTTSFITTSFSGFGSLTGGNGNDLFSFLGSGNVTGNIDGRAGSDTIDFSTLNAPQTVKLNGLGGTDGFTGTSTVAIGGIFNNIESLKGTTTMPNNGLIGPDNLAANWNIFGKNTGTLTVGGRSLNFGSFANLTGGNGDTIFVFKVGGNLSNNLAGAAGKATLDYSALSSSNVTLIGLGTAGHGLQGSGPGIGGTFNNIDVLIGGQGTNNTLTGFTAGNPVMWTITGVNQGKVTTGSMPGGTFSKFQNLTGGNAPNTFSFSSGGTITGVLDGLNNGTLDFSQVANVNVQINDVAKGKGFMGTATPIIGGTYTNINSFLGGASSLLTLAGMITNDDFDLILGDTLDTLITGTIRGNGTVVNKGHTLFGTGTIDELLINQGTLTPGTPTGPGTLNAKDVKFNTGGVLQPFLNSTGTSLLNASGTVDLGTQAILSAKLLNNFRPALDQQFVILKAATLKGTFQSLADGAPLLINGQAFRINYQTLGKAPFTQAILDRTPIATQTMTKAEPVSIYVGQPVNLVATVSWPVMPYNAGTQAPAGMVTFMSGALALGTVSLDGAGQATLTTSVLPSGTPPVTVSFTDPSDVPNSLPSTATVTVPVALPGVPDLAVGGAAGRVRVFHDDPQKNQPVLLADFAPFGDSYTGPIAVALGDINKDGIKDLVVGAAVGNPNVKVYDGRAIAAGTFQTNPDASLLASFFPYALQFNVGANVAVGDIEHDGYADIVTGATVGNPDVRVYSGKDIANHTFNPDGPSLLAQWFPYALQFNVGANVAVGDVHKDGYADIVTGATAGNPDVRVYSGQDIATGHFDPSGHSQLAQWFPYALQFNVGAFVAVGDVQSDGYADVITGASSGNPDVRVYSGKDLATGTFDPTGSSQLDQFDPFAMGQNIGAAVATADVEHTGKVDLVVGSTVVPTYGVFRGDGTMIQENSLSGQGFDGGGLYVGA